MKLIHRFGYFSVGLVMGIFILFFFLSGKKTTCDYSPNARTLKNIRIKERNVSVETMAFFNATKMDTSTISKIVDNGKVDFGKSITNNDPCNIYFITGRDEFENLEIQVENCDSIATIQNVRFLD